MKKDLWRTIYFGSIALIDLSDEPVMAFDDFLSLNFNILKQTKCIEENIFTDEEIKYLLYIYNLMNTLYIQKQKLHQEWKIDIWKDWSLNDTEVIDIKKWIVKFLSLESMKEDLKIVRSFTEYKWIWDFY